MGRRQFCQTTLIMIGLLALLGCPTPPPTPPAATSVRSWGTLREALRDGETQARVQLQDIASPHLVAVGAVAGLDGEITILDGKSYISQVRMDTIRTTTNNAKVAATILFGAEVPRWNQQTLAAPIKADELDAFILAKAKAAGLDTEKPFPFVLEGELLDLQIHVLAGECPIRARLLDKKMESPPMEQHFARTKGHLIGIHASHGGGVITHHGATTHIHALVEQDGEQVMTGHCEQAGIAAGATLRLPAR